MDAILHIGLPKAGSTHIQTWMALNAVALHRTGIATISTDDGHRLGVETFSRSEWSRPDIAKLRAAQDAATVMRRITAAAGQGLTPLVSSEYLSHGDPAKAARLFAAADMGVRKIIVFVRRQDRSMASGFTQEVRSLARSATIGDVAYHPTLDRDLLYRRWRKAFPAATLAFRNYDICRRDRTLIAEFKREIGVEAVATRPLTGWSNRGLSAEFTEIARMGNETGTPYDLDLLCRLDHLAKRRRFGFDAATTRRIEEIYRPSNAAFAARLGAEFDDLRETGWRSGGIDLTRRVSEPRMREVFAEAAAMACPAIAA